MVVSTSNPVPRAFSTCNAIPIRLSRPVWATSAVVQSQERGTLGAGRRWTRGRSRAGSRRRRRCGGWHWRRSCWRFSDAAAAGDGKCRDENQDDLFHETGLFPGAGGPAQAGHHAALTRGNVKTPQSDTLATRHTW